MAEQRVDVHDIRAKGDVTVAPTQIVHGATESAVRGWTEALLRGPLERCGLVPRAEQAERSVDDGEQAAAATDFEAIAEGLVRGGYEPAAEAYLQRAAAAHAAAGQRAEARSGYMRLARATLGDGSLDAQGHARRARELSDPAETWEPDGLLARAVWPERMEGDVEAVRAAWQRTQGTSAEVEWAAALVELLILVGDGDQARAVAEEARERHRLVPGDRLALELDYYELIEDDAADRAWSDVVTLISNPRLGIEVAGTAWQRRGVALTRRGDADAAHSAFLQAVQQWAREPGYDDQAAEAYFSGLQAHFLLGNMAAALHEARSLARALRGSHHTATSRTERLLRRGLRELVNAEYPDAFRLLSVAQATARRAGNLSDFLQASEALGDCLAATEKYGRLALRAYVQAGNPKKAKGLTIEASVDEVLQVVSLDGAPWERRAAWAAIAGARRNVSDEAAATIAEAALAEHRHEPAHPWPTNAAFYALEALGWAICAVPTELRGPALDVLRDRLQVGVGDPKHFATPFEMTTLAAQADETATLVDAVLSGRGRIRFGGQQLADMLDGHSGEKERLAAAAREGHNEALETLVFADALGDDPELLARARARVEAAIAASVREVDEDGGVRTVSYSGGAVATDGLMARVCSRELRDPFVGKLLETLTFDDVPLMTRVSAVEALQNLGPAMPDERVESVAGALVRLASSDDRPSHVDRLDADEPLARFKIDMAPAHALRAAAIDALVVMATHRPELRDLLGPVIAPAIASAAEPLVVAGLNAIARHPELMPDGLDLGLLLAAPWPTVRAGALGALFRCQPDAAIEAAGTLLGDPDDYVRRQLVGAAMHLGAGGRPLLEALTSDQDCFVRAMARARLGDIETES